MIDEYIYNELVNSLKYGIAHLSKVARTIKKTPTLTHKFDFNSRPVWTVEIITITRKNAKPKAPLVRKCLKWFIPSIDSFKISKPINP